MFIAFPYGIDAFKFSTHIIVDQNAAVHRNAAGLGQLGIGLDPGSHHDEIRLQHTAVSEANSGYTAVSQQLRGLRLHEEG
ncbi:hypothetical protein D3C76_1758170 [compost metagenome]